MEMSVARIATLRAAIAQDDEPKNRLAHAVILDLLDRATRADERQPLVAWENFPRAAVELIGERGWSMKVAVVANLVAIVDFAEPVDFLALSRLVKRYGHRAVATVQSTVDERLGTSSSLPLATRYARNVARPDEIFEGLVGNGLEPEKAREVVERCRRSGFWLVVTDVDPDAPGPHLESVEDVIRCADMGVLAAWRGQAAIVAANPWAPYPAELHKRLANSGRPGLADSLDEVIRHFREVSEQRDRQLVAREVRRLVAVSGLSQRQFAALCGTSAPRLSTYVNGLVTPSAAMMVRFARVSELAQQRAREERDSSA
jgi:hypothetical protein